jgi:hypothetical protein
MKVSVIMIMMMMMMVMIFAHDASLDPDPAIETKHSPLTQVSTHSFSTRQVF